MTADELELAAWRFLSGYRVGTTAVSYVEFIDGESGPAMRAPEPDGLVTSCRGESFGAAAVALAIELGMPSGAKGAQARERQGPDGVERLCNACGGWWPLKRMRRARGCHGGYANECLACLRERKLARKVTPASPL